MTRLYEKYVNEVAPALMSKFGYKSPMQIPKIEKIVINMGVAEAKENAKALEAAANDLAIITGQKPLITKARKSVANFKIREGMNLGCKVTLRKDKMYEFMDRLFNIALPRVRDFRGINPDSFDGRGNYAFGLKEQLIFPEIEYDKIDKIRGMDIIFVTTAKTDEEAKKAMIIKQQRTPKYATRAYTRCKICGRPHAYLRKFGICRICFRELAYKGQIPGVKKASW